VIRFEDMEAQLDPIVDKVWGFCERTGTRGRTVTLKVKYADFEQITRSRSFVSQVPSRDALSQASLDLLRPLMPIPNGVRLLGVTLSTLGSEEQAETPQMQLDL
jgi:DNA polymerase-4